MMIILDRDGVINYDRKDFVKSPEEWIPIPGSLEAIAQLNRAGFKIVIATNQSGLARGLFDIEALNSIHQKMILGLSQINGHVDGIYYCPHHPLDDCPCRKPKPGMLQQIVHDYKINLSKEAIAIGDSWRDIQAAQAAGCPAILVKTGNGEQTLREQSLEHILVFDDLASVASEILSNI